MISITLKGKEKVESSLLKLGRIVDIIKLWMEGDEVDRIMNDSFMANFRSQGRPEWKTLSSETIRTRKALGFGSGPILQQTGNLMDEITSLKGQVSSSSQGAIKEWGIDQLRDNEKVKFYAHQLGKGKSGQNLPAREMIGFQPEDSDKLKKSLYNWIFRQIK